MKSNVTIPFILVLFLSSVIFWEGKAYSQPEKIEIKLLGAFEQQNTEYKANDASGFGLTGQFVFRPLRTLDLNLRIDYEQMKLTQRDVLFEWEWNYWEKTYVDFLPGITANELNATLQYTSSDSIYSAVFVPTQGLKELKFSTGAEYRLPSFKKIQPYLGVNLGLSLFYRELKMTEHWIKRFKIDTLSTTRFDYEYKFDLTHFAPTREGNKIFVEPVIGGRFFISSGLDLDLSYHFVHYFKRDEIKLLAEILHISDAGDRWFPLRSKSKLMFGFTFKF